MSTAVTSEALEFEPVAKLAKLEEELGDDVNASLAVEDLLSTDDSAVVAKDDSSVGTGIMTEKDVGISEYISATEGIGGVIKQRYSDFLVTEVGLDGQMIRLTSTDLPPSTTSSEEPAEEPEAILSAVEGLPAEVLEQIPEIMQGDKSEILFEASDDKDTRKQVHETLKKHFPKLSGSTVEKSSKKFIKIQLLKNDNFRNRKRKFKGTAEGQYCHCVLYKENKDTIQTVNLLAKFLRTPASRITYAGTKDKRAKTAQRIAVQGVSASSLQNLNKLLYNIRLGDFSFQKESMQLGQLKGNHFNVILRNVTADDATVDQAVHSLKQYGFLNYYGMQRFGSTSVSTQSVGRAMLKSDWTEVVDLLLKPRGGNNSSIAHAQQVWQETKDAEKTLEALGREACIERHLLVGLTKCAKNDLVTAIGHIPRNQRSMYLHAFQSALWNRILSERFKIHRLEVLEGDLVMKAKSSEPILVTNETVKDFSVYDVVLPLPGYDIELPSNSLKELYEQVLEEEAITLESFKHRIRDYWLPGSYRHIAVKPENVAHSIMRYNDPSLPLVLSDYEKSTGETLPQQPTDGKYKALQVEFSLPPSTYATMALRELLKTDTSSAHQTTLNVT